MRYPTKPFYVYDRSKNSIKHLDTNIKNIYSRNHTHMWDHIYNRVIFLLEEKEYKELKELYGKSFIGAV
jgi:hypothetical protein